jgi:hypothetical protein
MRNLKLIWDFRGPDAQKTAEHHLIHLDEYLEREKIEVIESDVEKLTDVHSIAFIACSENVMPKLRDELKPHRGQLYISENE